MSKNFTFIFFSNLIVAFLFSTNSIIAENGNGLTSFADTVDADFSANIKNITEGDSINFADLSSGNPTFWKWTFSGGFPSQSGSQNPQSIHYTKAGKYAVKLVVSNGSTSDSLVKNAYITVNPDSNEIIPSFKVNATKIPVGYKLNFQDQTLGNPTSWQWTFLGGAPSSSTSANPTVTYYGPGFYDVRLVVSNGTVTDSIIKIKFIEVYKDTVNLNANFYAKKTIGTTKDTITFYDISSGDIKGLDWTFLGGTPNKSKQGIVKVNYKTPGKYSVSLVVTDSVTTDTLTLSNYITIYEDTTVDVSCDSLSNVYSNDTAVTSYYSGVGYYAGHNAYNDLASAEYFTSYTPGSTLNNVLLSFGYAKYALPASKVKVTVWDNTGGNDSPGNILATANVKISSIASDIALNKLTYVTFANAPVINSPFYVGVQFTYVTGDTVALNTNTGLNNPVGNAWQMYSDSTWHDFYAAWGTAMDLYVFPFLCTETQVITNLNEKENSTSTQVFMYPNPSEGMVNIGMNFKENTDVIISVYNTVGEVVLSNQLSDVTTSVHTLDLNFNAEGLYIVKVQSALGAVTKSIIVKK